MIRFKRSLDEPITFQKFGRGAHFKLDYQMSDFRFGRYDVMLISEKN